MVSAEYPPHVLGGAERQCQKLSAALVAGGRPVTVLTSSPRKFTDATSVDGVEVVRLYSRSSPQLGGRALASSVIWGLQVYRWVGRNRRDICALHAHQAKMNAVWAVIAGSLNGIPVIAKVGAATPSFDLDCLKRKRYFYGHLAAYLVTRLCSRFIAISDAVEVDLRNTGARDKILRLPNGVERTADHAVTDDERMAARRAIGWEPAGTYLVFAGRLSPEKNLSMLLQSFSSVASLDEGAHLVLVGDGELRTELEAQAAGSGYSDQVLFTGAVDDICGYLQAADALVLASLAEGMSNAVLEAMSLGVIPLASRVSGNTDLITPGVNGMLFDLNAESITASLLAFMALEPSERRAMSLSAYRETEMKYDIRAIAAEYEKVYRSL